MLDSKLPSLFAEVDVLTEGQTPNLHIIPDENVSRIFKELIHKDFEDPTEDNYLGSK